MGVCNALISITITLPRPNPLVQDLMGPVRTYLCTGLGPKSLFSWRTCKIGVTNGTRLVRAPPEIIFRPTQIFFPNYR